MKSLLTIFERRHLLLSKALEKKNEFMDGAFIRKYHSACILTAGKLTNWF